MFHYCKPFASQIHRLSSFDDQIKNFNKTKESTKDEMGEEVDNKLCNKAVHFIGLDMVANPKNTDLFCVNFSSKSAEL